MNATVSETLGGLIFENDLNFFMVYNFAKSAKFNLFLLKYYIV